MVTPAILIEHGITGFGSAALQRLIDDAEAEIVARYGSRTPVIEEYVFDVAQNRIWTKRQISSITSVEHGLAFTVDAFTALVQDAVDGFMIVMNRWAIAKLGGDFSRCVRVTYVPVSDDARRDRVIIDLINLSVRSNSANSLVSSKSVGDLSIDYESNSGGSTGDYNQEREKIMSALAAGQRTFA
jgi:hypothetical protein